MGDNIYEDIKQLIFKYFTFLKQMGLSEFQETHYAYEVHFECSNSEAHFDFSFEMTSSTAISVLINGYNIEHLEPDNLILKENRESRINLYDSLFQNYLKTNNDEWLGIIQDRYKKEGWALNEAYLIELSQMIKRHQEILSGEISLLKKNFDSDLIAQQMLKDAHRIINKTYTCNFMFLGAMECQYETSDLQDLKNYLIQQGDDISDIEVFDWNMQQIDFQLD